MSRKVIVFGATGDSGRAILNQLESNNIDFAVFVRKGSEKKIESNPYRTFFGDVLSKEDIQQVFYEEQFTDVIIALGSRDLKSLNIRSTGTKNIIDALKENNQNCKLHVLSAHGVGDSREYLKGYEKLIAKWLIGKAMKDHEAQEEYVLHSGLQFHVVRPVGLNNKEGVGNVYSTQGGKMPKSSISRDDVAKYLVESMLANETGKHSICNN
ncbi:MAG: SDR family oxidoreductase [Schleiferiaceae bacterium]|jgi:nucleoside-diphosphate-sugar epimerase|nr:SDR family oxidoreductase [Schleiferiaceae bacterium]